MQEEGREGNEKQNIEYKGYKHNAVWFIVGVVFYARSFSGSYCYCVTFPFV